MSLITRRIGEKSTGVCLSLSVVKEDDSSTGCSFFLKYVARKQSIEDTAGRMGESRKG